MRILLCAAGPLRSVKKKCGRAEIRPRVCFVTANHMNEISLKVNYTIVYILYLYIMNSLIPYKLNWNNPT